MRAVIQRISRGDVSVDGAVIGSVKEGLLVYLGVGHEDSKKEAAYLVEKIVNMRIFEDENGKMNRSLLDIQGELLIISQFTLYADCSRGNRPSFIKAAPPALAESLYEAFIRMCREKNIVVGTGQFGASMDVRYVNQGPVTIMLERNP